MAKSEETEGEILIRYRGVKKRFGAKIVFTGLDLDIHRGETLTILGASGSGKSVMLKMLIGLLPVDEGQILFGDQDLTELAGDAWHGVRRRIAYLFQGAALFDSLSVGENVAYGLREQFWRTMSDKEIDDRVEESLTAVGLPGIELMRPADLSGGMKKRVGLARTLALHPEILLYDEPTTGLDPINSARINNVIKRLKRRLGLTSIVITHDMTTAFEVSDRMAMLRDGRVLLADVPDVFRTTTMTYVRDFIDGRAPEVEDVETLLATS